MEVIIFDVTEIFRIEPKRESPSYFRSFVNRLYIQRNIKMNKQISEEKRFERKFVDPPHYYTSILDLILNEVHLSHGYLTTVAYTLF